MKVVIFKSGLGVSVHEIADISGTMQDMKISKLALCRGRLGLFFHIKILVNRTVLIKSAKISTEGQKFL